VSDASGSLEVTPVGKYPLTCEMLDTTVGVAVHMEMTSDVFYDIILFCRMPSSWILVLVGSLPGWAVVPLNRRRKQLSRMLWYISA